MKLFITNMSGQQHIKKLKVHSLVFVIAAVFQPQSRNCCTRFRLKDCRNDLIIGDYAHKNRPLFNAIHLSFYIFSPSHFGITSDLAVQLSRMASCFIRGLGGGEHYKPPHPNPPLEGEGINLSSYKALNCENYVCFNYYSRLK